MKIEKGKIITMIRTAIDDIVPTADDSFKGDTEDELWQAVQHAVTALSMELPLDLLNVSIKNDSGTVDENKGFAYSLLPDDYLRFVSLDVAGWAGMLSELIEPGSDAEKMQRSRWSRGTASKPKAMIDHDGDGKKVIVWWPGDETHKSVQFWYIPVPKLTEGNDSDETNSDDSDAETTDPYITCALKEAALPAVIYRAASIFFEGKKEPETAEKFRNI